LLPASPLRQMSARSICFAGADTPLAHILGMPNKARTCASRYAWKAAQDRRHWGGGRSLMGSAVSGLERTTNRTYGTSCGAASRKDGGREAPAASVASAGVWRGSFCMARCGGRARRVRWQASEGRCYARVCSWMWTSLPCRGRGRRRRYSLVRGEGG
jgi:hypothetical protein